MNPAGEMATVTLSLHAKQPKRATISFDKGYIEIFEYPRSMEATITYTEDGHKEVIQEGNTGVYAHTIEANPAWLNHNGSQEFAANTGGEYYDGHETRTGI